MIDLTRSTPRPNVGTVDGSSFTVQGGNLTSRMEEVFAATGRAASVRPVTVTATPAPLSVPAASSDQVRVKTEHGVQVKAEESTALLNPSSSAGGDGGMMGPPASLGSMRPGTPIVSRATPVPTLTPSRTTPAPTTASASIRTTNTPTPTSPTTVARTRQPSLAPSTSARQPSLAPSPSRLPISARTPTPAPRYNFFSNINSGRGRRARSLTPYTSPYRESLSAIRQGLGLNAGRHIVTRTTEEDVVMVDTFPTPGRSQPHSTSSDKEFSLLATQPAQPSFRTK